MWFAAFHAKLSSCLFLSNKSVHNDRAHSRCTHNHKYNIKEKKPTYTSAHTHTLSRRESCTHRPKSAPFLNFLIKSCGDKNLSKYFQTDKINHSTDIDLKECSLQQCKLDPFGSLVLFFSLPSSKIVYIYDVTIINDSVIINVYLNERFMKITITIDIKKRSTTLNRFTFFSYAFVFWSMWFNFRHSSFHVQIS